MMPTAIASRGGCPSGAHVVSLVAGPGDTNITIYTWDHRNQLASETTYSTYASLQGNSPSQVVTYTCDYLGDMIREGVWTVSSQTYAYTYTVYDGENPYLQVSDANHLANGGATAAVSQRDLYGPAVDQILATDNGGGNVLWGLGDNVGTIRDVVNISGALVNHSSSTALASR